MMNRQSAFDHIRMGQRLSKVNANSRLRFPKATMKKARSEEKNVERSGEGGGGSGVLDCVKFHSNRSWRISGCTHAQSEQLQGGDAHHQRARGRMQFRHGDRKNSAHFTFTPPPSSPPPPPSVSRIHALSFRHSIFFPPVDSIRVDLRVRQRATVARASTTSASCIVYPAYTYAHAARRAHASMAVFG